MNIALVLAFLFWIGSSFGWILELFFRRAVSGKWINPGFLTGPYLPIYGVGLCMLFGLSLIDMSFVENIILQNILIIVFMGLAMTTIEYVAGIIFIKGMKVKLWDYSKEWGNIQGIICPTFTFLWCVLGAIYYFFIQEHILDAVKWFSNNIAFSFVIGFFFGIITIDAVNAFNLVVKLKKFAEENDILVRFEELKASIREEQEKSREKINYLFAFRTNTKLIDTLNEYKNKYFNKNNTQKEESQMKNQDGVTATVLAATIVIMALIIGTISYTSLSSYGMNKFYNMRSDIELLDEKIAIYFLNEKELPIVDDDTRNINSLIENYDSSNANYNPNNSGTLYKIDLHELSNLSLNYSDYYIDETSHTIYKLEGISIDEVVYHTVPYNYQEIN